MVDNQANKKILRFAVMTNGDILKRWQREALERLIARGHKLVLIIENAEGWQGRGESKFKRYAGENAVYNLYVRFLQRTRLLRNIDCSELLSKADKVSVEPVHKGKYAAYLSDADVERIKAYNPDFILRFGFNIIKGDILNAARYGVWSFHHADEQKIRGGPPGFWEIYFAHTVNGIILQRLTDVLDGGLIIRKTYVPVIRHSYSTHLDELLKYGVDMLLFAVDNLVSKGGIDYLQTENSGVKIFRIPRNLTMILFMLKLLINRIKFNINDLFRHEDWNVGIARMTPEKFLEEKKIPPLQFAPSNIGNRFKADVFTAFAGDSPVLFYEDFDYGKRKGSIAAMHFYPETGEYGKPVVILEKPYHLAFPNLWRHDNKNYLLAESSQNGSLTAFELSPEMTKISTEKLVLSLDCVDSEIVKHDGIYWLFCTRKAYGTNINLFLYYSRDPFGEWKAHGLNPVVSDVRSARMAGKIIKSGGELYRPAQKNDLYYGSALVINKIIELSPSQYREENIFTVTAEEFFPYNKGVHNIVIDKGFLAADAKKYKFVKSEFLRKLKSKFNR